MASRRRCPSCQHRLSPLALECPVCGLVLGSRSLPRPLLFQASGLPDGAPGPRAQAIATPALGRVAPVVIDPPATDEPAVPGHRIQTLPKAHALAGGAAAAPGSSFWVLARLEAGEALVLALANLVLAVLVLLLLRVGPGIAYPALWPWLVPLHLAFSWTAVMVPLVLIGQSPLMVALRLRLEAEQPERRMAFSLFHLLSVALFPLSFLCMVLTPNHRTLAELLTGQEIAVSAGVRPVAAPLA